MMYPTSATIVKVLKSTTSVEGTKVTYNRGMIKVNCDFEKHPKSTTICNVHHCVDTTVQEHAQLFCAGHVHDAAKEPECCGVVVPERKRG
jgi:hypothetical protein